MRHDLRKGFTFVLQRLQMSERLRLPRNSQTLFPKMLRLPRIICISAKRAAPTTKNARQSHRTLRWPWNSAATRKSEDRRGATKKGPFRAKLSHARQLFATAAMALELRLSKRGSLIRPKNTAWRPCHQKTHFGLKKKRLARGFLKKHTPRRNPHLPTVAPASKS